MDGTKAQAKVVRGYALAAQRLGTPHSIVRPSGPTDPMASPATGTTPAVFDANELKFTKSRRRGEVTGTGLWDARITEPGDYLVADDGTTWCVASQDPLLPMTAFRCDRVVSVHRPGPPPLGVSDVYGGEEQLLVPVMTAFPAGMASRGGGDGGVGLPGDVPGGGSSVLLPRIEGADIRVSDVVVDDLGRRWRVVGVELSPAGWRLHVGAAVT